MTIEGKLTKEELSHRVEEFIDKLRGADMDVVQDIAAECGWDENVYYELCSYNKREEAWYPKDGSSYSIVDHAMDYFEEHWATAIQSLEDLKRLESQLRRYTANCQHHNGKEVDPA
jgi:hypothetical protein